MLYFKNRVQAGNLLADQIAPKHQSTKNTVVALSDGGVMVGAQIALRLKCALTLLLTSSIVLPRENDPLAVINEKGDLTYNKMYSAGEVEEMQGEYRTHIEEQRLQGLHDMTRSLGDGEVIRADLLKDHTVILVSDGLNNAFSLDAAADYLKPIKLSQLVVATPLASVPAVDRMHILADEIYCLNVVADYINTNHYYEVEDVPDHELIIKTVQNAVKHWK